MDLYYQSQLKKLQTELASLKQLSQLNSDLTALKESFVRARMCYKELAVLSEYYNPFETKYLNGPVLERVEEDNPQTIISPHGFQLLEEYLYGDWKKENYKLISKELEFISSMITRLQNEPDRIYKFKDETVLDAMRSSVLRLITLGISGFDSPVALLSISEATGTLTGIQNLIDFYKPQLERSGSTSYPKFLDL
ncbi:MAG TPA: hypothetical protein VNA26_06875, partial [Chitinophagaceae bacterium]|nr:hypothetical protein [Chitinophagaceae bacterium]